jgi:hypothetical protein
MTIQIAAAAEETPKSEEPGVSATQIRPARLKIRISIGTRSRIRITDGVETVEARGSLSHDRLGDVHAALRDDLETFSENVARLDQSAENAVKRRYAASRNGGGSFSSTSLVPMERSCKGRRKFAAALVRIGNSRDGARIRCLRVWSRLKWQ